MIHLGVATMLLLPAAAGVLLARSRPRIERYQEMEARRRAIEALI